jgi:serine/threonine protein phosphatase PrpC
MSPKSATVWRVIGASVVGAIHKRMGKPGQDALRWQEGKDFAILAVADGHGSERSPHSAVGASIAVEVAVQLLSEFWNGALSSSAPLSALKRYAEDQLPQAIVRKWAEEVKAKHAALSDVIPGQEEILLQYGSTLLATLATSKFLLFIQLGDGDILTVRDDGTIKRPIPKDARLFANETTSLCMPYAWREMEVAFWTGSEELPSLILLSTDGYANSFASEQDFLRAGPDYLALIRKHGLEYVAAHLEEWLAEASIHGSGDDITVGLIYRDVIDEEAK